MVFPFVIIGIVILSVGMSYWSIRKDMKKIKDVEAVKKDLSKGKVIYYSSSSKS